MDLIVDIIIEVFFELFGEGFLSLYTVFVPEKELSEEAKKRVGSICLTVALILLIGLLVGLILLAETNGKNIFGWILIGLSVLYVLLGIVLKIVARFKKRR